MNIRFPQNGVGSADTFWLDFYPILEFNVWHEKYRPSLMGLCRDLIVNQNPEVKTSGKIWVVPMGLYCNNARWHGRI